MTQSFEKAAGHAEMAGFWELMAHYRELTNKKGAFKISEKELGLMRELNPNNQKDTMVMKLARKRFLEYTSAQKIFSARDSQTAHRRLGGVMFAIPSV